MTVTVKFIVLSLLLLVNYCVFLVAAPATSSTKPKTYLVRNKNVSNAKDQLILAYALNDGTAQMKKGTLVQNDDGTGFVLNQEGSYSFVAPEGYNVKMSYAADKNGFVMKGYP
ncbi:larval cuticle protein 65Ag1-like [Melanaphis sacchari]|uniref:larval cuticle protein 65Ag1-like n=1 Tax=Melanaphis sacchari TaxID=742174 RepID=UPI000DC14EDA|nr:larval cuticle protein 65Ag1-like [Melanaphis sacchari]